MLAAGDEAVAQGRGAKGRAEVDFAAVRGAVVVVVGDDAVRDEAAEGVDADALAGGIFAEADRAVAQNGVGGNEVDGAGCNGC